MNCIIIDDEPLAREGLALKIGRLGYPDLIGQFHNGLDANGFLAKNQVDLIFLDIQMPHLTGLDLLRSLKNPPMVIFTTAFQDYAIESFDLDAVDYLLKPIDFQRFVKSVNKAREIHDLRRNANHEVADVQPDFIYLRADRQFIKVFYKDIKFAEGMKNYVMFHTHQEKIMTAISLRQILEQLPPQIFAQVNKSYLVNANFVRRVQLDSIILEDGSEIPFGKNYQDGFISRFVKGHLVERKPGDRSDD